MALSTKIFTVWKYFSNLPRLKISTGELSQYTPRFRNTTPLDGKGLLFPRQKKSIAFPLPTTRPIQKEECKQEAEKKDKGP